MNWFQKILHNRKEKKRLKKEAEELANKKAIQRSQTIETLINEYKKIERKESKLSRKDRESVIETVHALIKSGEIKVEYPPLRKV